MAHRRNHYDFAFEEYLRTRKRPYVLVDEQRRALLEEASLKSMDFIVYSQTDHNLLVDVKGRRFPSQGADGGKRWENWATADDLTSLLQWETVFGDNFRAVLVFAYDIQHERFFGEFDTLFAHANHTYAFYGVWVEEYQKAMKQRSSSWDTVDVPTEEFAELRAPIAEFLG